LGFGERERLKVVRKTKVSLPFQIKMAYPYRNGFKEKALVFFKTTDGGKKLRNLPQNLKVLLF